MQVRVKSIRKTWEVSVSKDASVGDVKEMLPSVAWTHRVFLCQGQIVSETTSLSSLSPHPLYLLPHPLSQPVSLLIHFPLRNYKFLHISPASTTISDIRSLCAKKFVCDRESLQLYHDTHLLSDDVVVESLGCKVNLTAVLPIPPPRVPVNPYQVTIQTVPRHRLVTVSVDLCFTVREVKELLAEKTGDQPISIRLIHGNKEMKDSQTIGSVHIGKIISLHAVFSFQG